MSESNERPLMSIIGLVITAFIVFIILELVFTQRALGAVTESKQAQEMDKLLSGIVAVCGDTNHPEVNDLYVTVFGEHQIRYERDVANFGTDKAEKVRDSGCNANCLCAFNLDEVVQCISMFSQETGCQDIDVREDGLISTSPLVFPEAGLFSHTENWLVKLPDFTCKFRLKLKWDGGSSPNRVLVEKLDAQSLIYTTGSELGARLGSTTCLF